MRNMASFKTNQKCFEMLSFLKQTRKLVNAKGPICIVLGNESCDLDSAVSAICLAYFYQHEKSNLHCLNYLPILNIHKKDYPLKTEVKYAFEEKNIQEELLTFRDELNQDFLNDNQIVLVDHHVSPFIKRCIAIYDHRPKDATANIPENCELHLGLVGSCATLVAEKFLDSKLLTETEKDILKLLRSTIILDTVNFSESAARATPKDIKVCLALEEALKECNGVKNRDELFELLVNARADVSSLTASQLLRKDFKILTSSKNEDIKIALPGFPLLVQHYILKTNADEAIKEFAEEFNCAIVLLMGMYIDPKDKSVHRDFGIIDINDSTLCKSIQQHIVSLKEPNLSIDQVKDCYFMNGSFYEQQNIKVTRKHLIPIVKSILDQ